MTELELGMESYPPAVLMAAPMSASRMRARPRSAPRVSTGGQGSSLTLTAGPAGYATAVRPADRPRNMTELQSVRLEDTAAWPEGAAVPIGTRGKRAHWTGTEWKAGASPGYTPAEPAGDETAGVAIGDEAAPAEQAVVELEDGQQVTGILPAEAAVPVTQELPVTPPPPWAAQTPAETPAAQFPDDGGDTAEDLHR